VCKTFNYSDKHISDIAYKIKFKLKLLSPTASGSIAVIL